MRLLVIALAACGSRTSIEASEPPRTAAVFAQRMTAIERPAQRPTEITGIVLDANGDHVEGALVELLVDGEPFENTTSDGMGQYVIAVPAGAYRVRFRYDDWVSEHDIVAVAGERTSGPTMVVERHFVAETEIHSRQIYIASGVTLSEDYVRNIQIPSEGLGEASGSSHCGGTSTDNTYYVEGISIGGLVLDDVGTHTIHVPGRTFESALGAAVGSQVDSLGVTFSSGTVIENEYVVDDVQVEIEGFTEPATIENLYIVDGPDGSE